MQLSFVHSREMRLHGKPKPDDSVAAYADFPFRGRTFSRNGARSMSAEKMRSMRPGRTQRWTRSREGAAEVRAFRECRRLRLMVFTESPGYRAFLYHDWLLPRALDRSLVLSSGILGARGTTLNIRRLLRCTAAWTATLLPLVRVFVCVGIGERHSSGQITFPRC